MCFRSSIPTLCPVTHHRVTPKSHYLFLSLITFDDGNTFYNVNLQRTLEKKAKGLQEKGLIDSYYHYSSLQTSPWCPLQSFQTLQDLLTILLICH